MLWLLAPLSYGARRWWACVTTTDLTDWLRQTAEVRGELYPSLRS